MFFYIEFGIYGNRVQIKVRTGVLHRRKRHWSRQGQRGKTGNVCFCSSFAIQGISESRPDCMLGIGQMSCGRNSEDACAASARVQTFKV